MIALADTSASHNYLSKGFLKAYYHVYGPVLSIHKISPQYITTAMGPGEPSDKEVEIDLVINGYKRTISAIVFVFVDHEFDLILGMPWLCQLKSQILWDENCLKFSDQELEFKTPLHKQRITYPSAYTSQHCTLLNLLQVRMREDNDAPLYNQAYKAALHEETPASAFVVVCDLLAERYHQMIPPPYNNPSAPINKNNFDSWIKSHLQSCFPASMLLTLCSPQRDRYHPKSLLHQMMTAKTPIPPSQLLPPFLPPTVMFTAIFDSKNGHMPLPSATKQRLGLDRSDLLACLNMNGPGKNTSLPEKSISPAFLKTCEIVATPSHGLGTTLPRAAVSVA